MPQLELERQFFQIGSQQLSMDYSPYIPLWLEAGRHMSLPYDEERAALEAENTGITAEALLSRTDAQMWQFYRWTLANLPRDISYYILDLGCGALHLAEALQHNQFLPYSSLEGVELLPDHFKASQRRSAELNDTFVQQANFADPAYEPTSSYLDLIVSIGADVQEIPVRDIYMRYMLERRIQWASQPHPYGEVTTRYIVGNIITEADAPDYRDQGQTGRMTPFSREVLETMLAELAEIYGFEYCIEEQETFPGAKDAFYTICLTK